MKGREIEDKREADERAQVRTEIAAKVRADGGAEVIAVVRAEARAVW
jgi:hypothetical protein